MADVIKLQYRNWGTYNNPESNERRLELPVAFWFIKNYKHNLIEIGEVTCFYAEPEHKVYDIRKENDKTTVMDAYDVDYTNANVLSISTIEHVCSREYGQTEIDQKDWLIIEKIKKQSKNYLISFPVGFNKDFDKMIESKQEKYLLMKRNELNNWYKTEQSLLDFDYSTPYHAGNAVAFLTNLDIEFTFGV